MVSGVAGESLRLHDGGGARLCSREGRRRRPKRRRRSKIRRSAAPPGPRDAQARLPDSGFDAEVKVLETAAPSPRAPQCGAEMSRRPIDT